MGYYYDVIVTNICYICTIIIVLLFGTHINLYYYMKEKKEHFLRQTLTRNLVQMSLCFNKHFQNNLIFSSVENNNHFQFQTLQKLPLICACIE